MDYYRLKIKCSDNSEVYKVKLLNLCTVLSLKLIKPFPVHDGFTIMFESASDVDKLFSDEGLTLLQSENFRAIMPPAILAMRTILLFRTDDILYKHDPAEIATEIEAQNDWCKVANIYKLSNNSIKICLINSSMANLATSRGLRIFHFYIPGRYIKKDQYRAVTTRYRCYALDHTTHS